MLKDNNLYVGRVQTTNVAKERFTDEDNLEFTIFFDLDKNNEDFPVFNQYNLSDALKRIENFDLKYFQVKEFELSN